MTYKYEILWVTISKHFLDFICFKDAAVTSFCVNILHFKLDITKLHSFLSVSKQGFVQCFYCSPTLVNELNSMLLIRLYSVIIIKNFQYYLEVKTRYYWSNVKKCRNYYWAGNSVFITMTDWKIIKKIVYSRLT